MRFVLRAVHPGARPSLSGRAFHRTRLYLFANAGFKALGARTWLLETVGAGVGVTGRDGDRPLAAVWAVRDRWVAPAINSSFQRISMMLCENKVVLRDKNVCENMICCPFLFRNCFWLEVKASRLTAKPSQGKRARARKIRVV